MSEADAETDGDAVSPGGTDVWIEKYRPELLSDIKGHEDIVPRLERYVATDDLPHLMFAGPAGTGKCVTGETPVLTSDGVTPISEVAGDVEGFDRPEDDFEVLTYGYDGNFEYVAPSQVFSKKASDLVSVETRDGGEITVTPEHKLLVADEGGLSWREAGLLSGGERIARPLSTPVADDGPGLDWLSAMDGDRTFVTVSESFAEEYAIPAEENYVGQKKTVISSLRRGDSLEEITAEHDVSRNTAGNYARSLSIDLERPSTTCSLSYLRELDADRSELRSHVEFVRYVTDHNRRSDPITPPWEMTPELARFVGLSISEARIENGRIKFYNTNDTLLDTFERLAETLFGVETAQGIQKDVPYVELRTKSLHHFLASCFDAFGDSVKIGSTLVHAPTEVRAAFLQAVFDSEAYVADQGTIELTQKDESLITLCSYLLASFGIPTRRKRVEKAATNGSGPKREYHSLYVSGTSHLSRFADEIGFTIDHKRDRLADATAGTGNPNHDTIPAQEAIDDLCGMLTLEKGPLVTENLNPDNPGRESYLEDIDRVLDAASERIETAQRVRQEVESLRGEIRSLSAVPSAWIGDRAMLDPIETRTEIAETTGVRTDRLLEYADGRRSPTASRAGELLVTLGSRPDTPDTNGVQTVLGSSIDALGVSDNYVGERTELLGRDVRNLVESEDHDLATLARFDTVADRIHDVTSEMCSMEVLERLSALERLSRDTLYFDRVTEVEPVEEDRRVYDLTVPGTRNYVAGRVPTVMHNTTASQAIAREIYGDDWRENFLELNASDERGIDVVRDRIKNFARTSFGGYDYRVIFLDEADALCVPPGTEVVTGYPSSPEIKRIEEVAESGEPIPSVDFETNEIQPDKGTLVNSGVADFFELELEDERSVLASPTHPFFVVGEDGKLVEKELHELSPGDEIADFRDDIGVSRCEACGDWTAGRFCSLDCKNEGHSLEMEGENNPMYGTEWSEKRREKIVEKLSDGRFEGANNPNYGGDFHGTPVWEMDEETIERFRETISEMRSGTSWDDWVVDADPEAVKEEIGRTSAEWWASLDEDKKANVIEKSVENHEYPVCDITGDDNPMRDPEVARKVSEALKGHEPTGGNVRHSDELGHLVRSDWEYEVAKALQDAGIEYEYEPEFELSDSVFHPDFLINETVIEVKGVAKLWGQTEKVEEFLETYGDDYRFVVVGDSELPHHEHYERDEFEPAVVSDGGLRTVQTVEVSRIEYSHRGKAYNISMENTPNFMLANGILTHNTSDAQSALRRTMEQFSNTTRFILSCNYSSQIIDPIQSRCAVFRFTQLSEEAIEAQIREIASEEEIEVTDDGVDALVYAAAGDMRKAINGLQAAAVMGEVVDEETVFAITSTARPEEVEAMVDRAIEGDFTAARAALDDLLTDRGLAGGDVIDQLHRSAWEFDLEERETVRLLERLGEADYRITEGAGERLQLEALLASLALEE